MTDQPAAGDEREEIAGLVRSILSLHLRDPSISTLQFADNIIERMQSMGFRRAAPQDGVEDKNDNRAYSWCHSLEREKATGRFLMCLWPTCKCPRVSAPTPPRTYAEDVAYNFLTMDGTNIFADEIKTLANLLTTFAAARVAEAVEREREAIEKLAEGKHLVGSNPIGALYGVGWDSAVSHVVAAIRERKP